MELFSFKYSEAITPQLVHENVKIPNQGFEPDETRDFKLPNATEDDPFRSGFITNSSTLDLSNQFISFQFSNKLEGPSILESSQVQPTIDGSPQEPDVLMDLEMLSFCVGSNENIEKDAKATIRVNIGKDENSRDKYFDTAFWSIAAGLSLYDNAQKKMTNPKDLRSDFKRAFGNRPIEIPGGLSKMTFEVVKHKEPQWWQKIFKFLESDTGKTLISTVGFPAITSQAINMLDELLNRLTDSQPEVLFKSLPLRLALSNQAKEDFTAGSQRIKVGCLNPGICILARGRDFNTILNSDSFFYPAYGKLVPSKVSEAQLMEGKFDDPLKDVTYAVFRVGMKKTKLDPTFNYH